MFKTRASLHEWSSTGSRILIAVIILLNISTRSVNSQQQVVRRELVSINQLPESFSDDKLPNKDQNATDCFNYIGCFEKIPKIGHSPADPNDIGAEFILITRDSVTTIPYQETINCLSWQPETCETYPFSLETMIKSNFNPQLQTVILTAGFRTSAPCAWQRDIKDRLLDLKNVNVIITCWNKANHDLYGKSSANTRVIAKQITVLLYYLAQLNDLQLSDDSFAENIYLVGHSLGAHISGFVGQDLGGRVGRITGLDPAGPNFNDLDRKFRLDKTDALLVDSLHTNGGKSSISHVTFGTEHQVGHVDYYANNGQSQPSCSHDIFGCSHKIAPTYYLSFLEYELSLRKFLGEKYHNGYRFFAYRSGNYESFMNGSSFSQLCPTTSLDDSDLHSVDINKCVLPVDYVSNPGSFRRELRDRYNINLDPSSDYDPAQKFFFLTKKEIPYLNNHNLIKIRITKTDKDMVKFTQECSISLKLTGRNGIQTTAEIMSYNLINQDDHFELLMPYVSAESSSIYKLAKMDSNDYYLNETSRDTLLSSLNVFFPMSISIEGLGNPKEASIVDNIKGAISYFFGLGKQEPIKDRIEETKHLCNVNMEAVVVQPLKKAHRHLVAAYTIDGQEKAQPDIVVLNDGEVSPKIELFKGHKVETTTNDEEMASDEYDLGLSNDNNDNDNDMSMVFMDTVIIGPHDKSYDANLPEESSIDLDDVKDEGATEIEHEFFNTSTSFMSGKMWLISTGILISATAVLYSTWPLLLTLREGWRKEEGVVLID